MRLATSGVVFLLKSYLKVFYFVTNILVLNLFIFYWLYCGYYICGDYIEN
jgi:hypothetical protein